MTGMTCLPLDLCVKVPPPTPNHGKAEHTKMLCGHKSVCGCGRRVKPAKNVEDKIQKVHLKVITCCSENISKKRCKVYRLYARKIRKSVTKG